MRYKTIEVSDLLRTGLITKDRGTNTIMHLFNNN